MKKLRLLLIAILLLTTVTALSSCAALDSVFLFGEDIFDTVIGAIDKSPLGAIYDALNIEGLITGENGGNFENPDEPTEDTLKVESLTVDTEGVKTVFAFGEDFTTDGLKVIATFTDGSTKEIPLSELNIKSPDTTSAGVRMVTIVYGGKSARYEITVNQRVIPDISDKALVNISEKNDSVPYRVEAEAIDLATSGAAGSVVAATADVITSGNKYLKDLGKKYNYFGFTFNAAETFEGVTIVLRVSNSSGADIDAGAVKTYLNFTRDDNGVVSGEFSTAGHIIAAGGEWVDIIIRNVTIPEGTNTLTFDVQGDDAFDIDYIDFYVGSRYINSVVEIKGTDRVIKDIETLDTEKAFTRSDVAAAHNLKDGQLFVEPVKKEWPGCTTSGGTSVGAIGKGSLISTTLRFSEDATIRIWFKASKTTPTNDLYYVDDHWSFYIDGVQLQFVDYVDIHGGDKSQEMYWEWKLTNLGEINLPAGDHTFVIEVVGTDCNVDTIEFEILSLGSYDEIGKGLDEQIHICKDVCPVCGNCLTSCSEDACAVKCQGCLSAPDVVINEDKTYVFEAENFDLTHLTPSTGWEDRGIQIETPSTTTPYTSGGKSLGACGGGYTTITIKLEEKATVKIYGRLALRVGGEAASLIGATLGDVELAVSGTVPAGVSDNTYFNWEDCPFGAQMDLEAGEYTLTITFLSNPNFDCVKIDVVSYGKFASEVSGEEKVDVTVGESGITKYELENINSDQCDIITRKDFVDKGVCDQGDVGRGSGRIYGFDNGSVFRVYVKVTEPCTLKISIAGFADTSRGGDPNLSSYSWKLGDSVITPDEDAAIATNGVVSEAVVGTVQITETGIYVFEFSFGVRTDLDYIAFEVVE